MDFCAVPRWEARFTLEMLPPPVLIRWGYPLPEERRERGGEKKKKNTEDPF